MMESNKEGAPRWWLSLLDARTTLLPALAGSLLAWLAFPPAGLSLLVWIAPVPWLLLVARDNLPGRRPYLALWLAGLLFWLLVVHWIRLPHPLNYLAWLGLAGYLGLYLPVFVGLSRVGVHGVGLPLWLVAPVVWTGLDWIRGHLFTGFLMGSLAHTQVNDLVVIQIADLVGEYGVTLVIMLVAAAIAGTLHLRMISPDATPRQFLERLFPAALALLVTFGYGNFRLADLAERQQDASKVNVALIQGNTLPNWKPDPDRQQQIMAEYLQLTYSAIDEAKATWDEPLDLLVWPETSFRQTLMTVESDYTPPREWIHPSHFTAAQEQVAELVQRTGTPVLVGVDRTHIYQGEGGKPEAHYYNSAALVNRAGELIGIYDKMHRVPFGEYIPFAEWFPSLYNFTPLTGGIQAGAGPSEDFSLDGVQYIVSICYETVVPHLIRRQVNHLDQDRFFSSVMVNLTNDAWFWGSSELDMHLASGVFRAVEMRLPLVIAANGGLSAGIELTGHVPALSKRQQPQVLLAEVSLPGEQISLPSFYARWGDWLAILCVVCCTILAVGKRCQEPFSAVSQLLRHGGRKKGS